LDDELAVLDYLKVGVTVSFDDEKAATTGILDIEFVAEEEIIDYRYETESVAVANEQSIFDTLLISLIATLLNYM